MELFRDVNIDWLGKKWYFLVFSLIFSVAGVLSLLFWHGLPLDVDFHGGTLVRVKFDQRPDVDRIRHAADKAGLRDPRITTYGVAQNNEVMISLSQRDTHETSLDAGRAAIIQAVWRQTTLKPQRPTLANSISIPSAGQAPMTSYLSGKDRAPSGNRRRLRAALCSAGECDPQLSRH